MCSVYDCVMEAVINFANWTLGVSVTRSLQVMPEPHSQEIQHQGTEREISRSSRLTIFARVVD